MVEVSSADIDETPGHDEDAATLVERLARSKAAQVAIDRPEAVIVGADTVVVCDGVILGKPVDEAEAAAMLSRLSDRSHTVITGVAVMTGDQVVAGHETTEVSFRVIDQDEIDWYIATGEPLDKAGAYGIQGAAALFVRSISGSHHNVMGLSLHHVDSLLRQIGPSLVDYRQPPSP